MARPLHLVVVALLAACKTSGPATAEHEAGAEGPAEYRGVAVAPPPVVATVIGSDGGSTSCVSLVAQMVERACDVHVTDAGAAPPQVPGRREPVLITLVIGPPGAEDGGFQMMATPYFPDAARCIGQSGLWSLPSACRQGVRINFARNCDPNCPPL